ncbi:hypothetical protein GCM10020358_31830 [Amorphoplanes nipponensis]|uniref:GNAT family N-acetyltransferase n=1 Tax=Actinoplanes nipponensis TaxID=135950 RepID=UPI0031E520A9
MPPGYPRAFEREVRLSDGRTALVRPIVPEDREQLARAIRTADPDTVYRRFLGAPPHITPALLTHLCTVDYRKRFALVASDPRTGTGTAIARYEATADDTAEVAVAVDPAWRRVGLASALVEMLAQAALDRGVHTFSAYYLAENRPVSALLTFAGGDGSRPSARASPTPPSPWTRSGSMPPSATSTGAARPCPAPGGSRPTPGRDITAPRSGGRAGPGHHPVRGVDGGRVAVAVVEEPGVGLEHDPAATGRRAGVGPSSRSGCRWWRRRWYGVNRKPVLAWNAMVHDVPLE